MICSMMITISSSVIIIIIVSINIICIICISIRLSIICIINTWVSIVIRGGNHLSNATCLTHVFFKRWASNAAIISMTLDTTNNTYNKRGRIRQVELDK